MHKLGVIVPYRDRPKQLREFIRDLSGFLMYRNARLDYEVIVVNQKDIKKFNRGKLLNIGFIEAEKRGCDYVIFHDVDMIPTEGSYKFRDYPVQLANTFEFREDFKRTITKDYFGGVTLFPVKDFRKINGYSNKYRGWGFEDNDLLLRCVEKDLPLKEVGLRTPPLNKNVLKFNGKNSIVKVPNKFTFVRPISFMCTFKPDPIKCNPNEITDEFAAFGIPGYDLNLSFNSFRTYKFELFLVNDVTYSITTEYIPNMTVRCVVTVDPKTREIEFYVNGEKIGKSTWDKYQIRKYSNEPFLYLGAAAPGREDKPKFFKGNIDSFAVFNRALSREEIKDISLNINDKLLTSEEFGYSEELSTYYDTRYIKNNKLVDLSSNENHGTIVNCDQEYVNTVPYYTIKLPKRERCKYRLLKHEEGGYVDGYWKDWQSRKNQIHYTKLVEQGFSNLENDGISTCKYTVLDVEQNHLYVKLNVRT